MGPVKYQEVNVTLSAATFSRLAQANPFNRRRVAEQAVETIRAALYTMYPPRTPEEWKDSSRFQGIGRHILVIFYDIVCYLFRRRTNPNTESEREASHDSEKSTQLTLKIPLGMMRWIEKIAHSKQSTIPEATIYAIEYGFRVLDSQGDPKEIGQRSRDVLLDILRAIWTRIVGYFNAAGI